MKSKIRSAHIIFIYLSLWFIINIFILTGYPFVHSDEPWLSGLSRSMMETGSPSATEDFFDLYERNPHAIKILFHLIQIPAIAILGYSIFTVRLLSLIAGTFSLLLLYRLILKLNSSKYRHLIASITILWLSFDVQFLYISHMARQEIFLVLILLSMLNMITGVKMPHLYRGTLTGLLLGSAVGFHPNSFIIAWPVGLILAVEMIRKKRKWSEGAVFLIAAGVMASLFIALSFHFNPDFISDYRSYGEPLGVLRSPDMKLISLPGFYSKLFHQVSGTYHTPDIKMQMILFPVFLLIGFIRKQKKPGIYSLIGFTGFNIGLFVIGKYSQPSISFLLPFYYLSAAGVIELLISGRRKKIMIPVIIVLTAATLFFSIKEISGENESYKDYLKQIKPYLQPDSIVLSGLDMEYAVPEGQVYDWRNLSFLGENNLSFDRYIAERNIQYIIVPEELAFIYNNRPYWNVLYGNIAHWYPQLLEFTQERCSMEGEFTSSYAMRIAAYRYGRPWFVRVYKVDQMESSTE